MRIVVAGGTGFIGRRLCASLAADGHAVTVISRTAEAGASPLRVAWDGPWQAALEGADAVVNLAGEGVADRRWSAARKLALRSSRIETTRRIVSALEGLKRPPAAFVAASAVGFYGDCGDATVTEQSPAGKDFLAELCRDWEAEAVRARRLGVRVVVARLGILLSPAGGALPRMALPFKLFVGGPLGSGEQYMPWIHSDDAVDIVRWAMLDPSVDGPVNVTAPEPAKNREFSKALASVLGRPCLFRAPAAALRLAVGELADMLLGGQRAVPARALAGGYQFRHPDLRGALRDLLG